MLIWHKQAPFMQSFFMVICAKGGALFLALRVAGIKELKKSLDFDDVQACLFVDYSFLTFLER